MAELFLTRATLHPSAADNPRLWQQLANDYGVHQLIWQWFEAPAGTERDFLYRIDSAPPGSAGPVVHTLSRRAPKDQNGHFSFEVKHYAPVLETGDWLEFQVRVSPTRVKSRGPSAIADGKRVDKSHGKRVDVVMDAKYAERGLPNDERTPEAVQVQRTCSSWLLAKQERLGIEVELGSLLATSYRQQHLGHGAKGGSIRYSTVDLSGRLQIVDPQAFLTGIGDGLGPQKAFGCGLWLIKRAR